MISKIKLKFYSCLLIFLAVSCGGSSGGEISEDSLCDGSCADTFLTKEDVSKILSQAILESKRQGVNGNFAVLDRVGNVLALYQMPEAKQNVLFDSGISANGGLESANVSALLAAISKAGTGAYLSSQGNAFSTRTASQIIQENFNPGEQNQPAGPLFGVQFSQLICSDITVFDSSSLGPRPLPLGLSADPGGFPLYKNGVVVGGIGVEIDGLYGVDRNIRNLDTSIDEIVAYSASNSFHAPEGRRAEKIFPGGKSLRYTDFDKVEALPEASVELESLVSLRPFTDGNIRQGSVFGAANSGILKVTRLGLPASILVDQKGQNRFPTISGSENIEHLTSNEVEAILDSAFFTAHRTRAAIRRPLDTASRVSIWVVDHLGKPIGFVRSEDAPVFGIDVALQKARTAAFFSSPDVKSNLQKLGLINYFNDAIRLIGEDVFNGNFAFSNRAIGNLSRPYFPDGINGNLNGPFSLPFPNFASERTWSPFNTGLQLDLSLQSILEPLSGKTPESCVNLESRLANGLQIFPGSVPLYKNGFLVGALGVSGDGVDQDDLIAFYGASRQGLNDVGHLTLGDSKLGFNAALDKRVDTITTSNLNLRLRYTNCPEAPFIGNNEQEVCEGL